MLVSLAEAQQGGSTKEAIRALARANRSQAALAGRLGVTPQYISNLATGSADMTLGFIGRVYVVLGPDAAGPLRRAALADGIIETLFEVRK